MITRTLDKIIGGAHMTELEAKATMGALMDGLLSPAQIGGLLTALRMKGEVVAEITGFARAMRERSVRVPTSRSPLLDTCGTGGDRCKTFNVSTTAAFVAAAAGVAVAKHGNRSVTSKCGSADVLEALGIRLDLTPDAVGRCIDSVGIGFLFARSHHPAMKHAAAARTELGFRTVFNALGPLTNPAGATRQLIGVYDSELCEPLAEVLANLGSEHVLVVHGVGGLDEISTLGETVVAEAHKGCVTRWTLTPDALGLPPATIDALAPGRDAAENAAMLEAVLRGETGPRRDIVLANAGAALVVAGTAGTIVEGVAYAADLIDSGQAHAKLDALREFTQQEAATA